MLHDGCTAVIGGVIREQPSNNGTQLPLLGNLPLSGFVYHQTNETPGRAEVLVLITPRIVRESAPAKTASQGPARVSTGRARTPKK